MISDALRQDFFLDFQLRNEKSKFRTTMASDTPKFGGAQAFASTQLHQIKQLEPAKVYMKWYVPMLGTPYPHTPYQ